MRKNLRTIFFMFVLALIPAKVFAATSISDLVSNYLPYVLIGGAVILLISIVGILFSKKKEKPAETPTEAPVNNAVTPVEATAPVAEETQPAPAPVNMDEISNSLYTPSAKPTIQETLGTEAPTENITTPSFTEAPVQASASDQVSDLQDILKGEIAASPMAPEAPQAQAPATEVAAPMDNTTQPVATIDTTQPAPDFQQLINSQAQIPSASSEIPPVQATTITPNDLSVPTTNTTVGS